MAEMNHQTGQGEGYNLASEMTRIRGVNALSVCFHVVVVVTLFTAGYFSGEANGKTKVTCSALATRGRLYCPPCALKFKVSQERTGIGRA